MLTEKPGINPPNHINPNWKKNRQNQIVNEAYIEQIFEGILSKNLVALAKGITLIESENPKHYLFAQNLIAKCLPFAGKSIRIGITGVPGVGKSTFIESMGNYLVKEGHRLAVLAIDPTSTKSKGSILGDKTRMEELVKTEHAFIRPSASGNSLGGVAKKTREAIVLCEAAGFDTIFVETVGVGQSETAVHSMTDFFLLLQIAGAGDELQGIKRGIMEMADAIVINKSDGDNVGHAKKAKQQLKSALQLFVAKKSEMQPEVFLASALENRGMEEIYTFILKYFEKIKANQFFTNNRNAQQVYWFNETVNNLLMQSFYQNETIMLAHSKLKEEIMNNSISPFFAAEKLLQLFDQQKKH